MKLWNWLTRLFGWFRKSEPLRPQVPATRIPVFASWPPPVQDGLSVFDLFDGRRAKTLLALSPTPLERPLRHDQRQRLHKRRRKNGHDNPINAERRSTWRAWHIMKLEWRGRTA